MDPDDTTLAALSRPRRALVLLSGNLTLLAIALVLGGPHALASAARLPMQLAWLALDSDRAVEALRAFASRGPSLGLVATLAAKLAAANLLPLPPLNGGALALLLLPGTSPGRRGVATVISMLLLLGLAVALVIALLRM